MKKLEANTHLVIGKNSVRETLRWAKDRVLTLLAVKDPQILLGDSYSRDLACKSIDFDALSDLANSDSHQGVAALVQDAPKVIFKERIKELAAKQKSRVAVLASLQDPHHLGAIFRAAEAFGIDLIIWSTQHCPGITAAVTKVAVGATELVPFCEVVNINDALRKLKEAGFWVIAAEPSSEKQDLSTFEFPSHSAIVFGAEGEGLPRLTLELADFKVAITQSGKIDSVSLSQAAAVFFFRASQKV